MDQRIVIRPAGVSEQRLLEALQTRASLSNPDDREALLANPSAIELPIEQILAGGVFVLEFEGNILGFAAILPRADGNVELDALFVEPAVWRRGYGKMMIEHCANAARAAGSSTLHVTGNPHARQFYLACRFTQVGSVATRFGFGDLLQRVL